MEGRGWSYSAPGGETRIAGTASAGDAATGDTERVDRLGEKKDVNLEEVLENDEERPWGTVDVDLPEVERVWADADDLDALLRTIPSFLKGCVCLFESQALFWLSGERAGKVTKLEVGFGFFVPIQKIEGV